MKPRTAVWTFLMLCCAFAFADTLPPVVAAKSSGVPGWAYALAALLALCVVGYFMLRRKKPAVAAAIQNAASMEESKLVTEFRAEVKAINEKLHALLAPIQSTALNTFTFAEAKPSTAKSFAVASTKSQETTMGITTVIPQETIDWMRTVVTANPPAEPATPVPTAPVSAIPYKIVDIGSSHIRVDSVVPPGTPGTVTVPVTGHTLSLPQCGVTAAGVWDGTGEGFINYVGRVCLQAGWGDAVNGINQSFGAASQASGLRSAGKDEAVASWPAMADEWFNRAKYSGATPEQIAATQAQWDAVEAKLRGG